MSLIHLDKVIHSYDGTREALRVHELAIEQGEVLTVVGPNGSGKSTLLEALAFLIRPTSGVVALEGRDVWREGDALDARRRCPMLLQRTVLFSTSVLKNVTFGLRIRGVEHGEAIRRAEEALELVGMKHLARRAHNQLSGGERRRTALAQLLALESKVIVLDEPMASLDPESEDDMASLILTINRERGVTIVMAGHNLDQATALSSRVVTLIDAKLFPEPLDNLLTGVMRKTSQGFELRHRRGWSHVFEAGQFVQDVWEGIGPVDGAVQVAFGARSVEAVAGASENDGSLRGVITALHEHGNACRVTLALPDGPNLRAALPRPSLASLGVNLGGRLSLRIKPESVNVLPAQEKGQFV